MSILDIRVLGDPILRQATTPVAAMTDELLRLIKDMFDTMHHARGIGLAAPQVGRTERLTVVEVDDVRLVLINPEVVERAGKAKGEEGCLSIPDIYADVERPGTVTVRALDENFKPYEIEATDLLARCLQHEIDHLDGKLFIDYLSPLKRKAAMSKWEKAKSEYAGFIRKVRTEVKGEHHHANETEM